MTRAWKSLLLAALVGLACGMASAGAWKAARWQALFEHVPAPPARLEQAGAMIGPSTDDKGHPVLGITDAGLLRSKQDLDTAVAALNAAAGAPAAAVAGIDTARMQSDPAYAAQVQAKLQSMSQAQKMQMAMRMAAAQRASMQPGNVAAIRAAGALQSWVHGDGGHVASHWRAQLRTGMQDIAGKYDARHASLDRKMRDQLKACPAIPRSSNRCGDTDCPPDPACIAALNARVPALIAAHRKLAGAELAEEGDLFARARAALQPVMAKTAQLTTAVETTGGSGGETQAGTSMLMTASTQMQEFTALALLRTGYWQNIRQRTQPDSYFVGAGELGYHYTLGDDPDYPPPTDLPSGW